MCCLSVCLYVRKDRNEDGAVRTHGQTNRHLLTSTLWMDGWDGRTDCPPSNLLNSRSGWVLLLLEGEDGNKKTTATKEEK